jgi:nucleoid DNA-binding protein
MNKTDLIKKITENNEITLEKGKKIVNEVFEEIKKSLAEGENVSITGFGSWNVSILNGRKGTVPKTDKKYKSEDKYVVRFKPSKDTKKIVAERKVK